MSATVEQLDAIAQGILNHVNEVRHAAEAQYYAVRDADVSHFLSLLLGVVTTPTCSLYGRFFCAEMLRQNLMPSSQTWAAASPAAQEAVRDGLSHAFSTEADPRIRRRLTFAIAALALRLSAGGDLNAAWPGLVAHTLAGCSHADASVRLGCFELLARLGESTLRVFAPCVSEVAAALLAGLADPTLAVAVKALQAVSSVAMGAARLAITADTVAAGGMNPEADAALMHSVEHALTGAVAAAGPVLANALNADDEDLISDALDALKDIARCNSAHYFAPSLAQMLPLLSSVASAATLDSGVRVSALMLLLAIADSPRGKEMVRKSAAYAPTVLQLVFAWLSEVRVTQDWLDSPTTDDELANPLHHNAVFALSRLPAFLTGAVFTKLVITNCLTLLRETDWTLQVAGLLGVMAVVEKAWKAGAKHLMSLDLAPFIAPTAAPRVRWTALGLLGQLAGQSRKYVSANLQRYLPLIVGQMDPEANPVRIVCTACHYFVELLASVEAADLKGSQDVLFGSLTTLISSPVPDVQMAALSAVSALAVASQSDFAPYYPGIMAGLLGLLEHVSAQLAAAGAAASDSQTQQRQLASKACETVGFVAHAGGHELFLADAPRAVAAVSALQAYESACSDGIHEHTTRAVKSFTTTLGRDFAPYLDAVLGPLLHAADLGDVYAQFDLDAEDRILPQDADRAAFYSENNGYSILVLRRQDGAGRRRIAIHTARIQEKILACEMICQLANELKDVFGPHVERCANVLGPLCTFRFNPAVRAAALASMPALFDSFKEVTARSHALPAEAHEGLTYAHLWTPAASAQLQDMWGAIFGVMMQAGEMETLSNFPSLLLAASATLDHNPVAVEVDQLVALAQMGLRMVEEAAADRPALLSVLARANAGDSIDEETLADTQNSLSLSNTALDAASVLFMSVLRNAGHARYADIAALLLPVARHMLEAAPDATGEGGDGQAFCTGLVTMSNLLRFSPPGAEMLALAEGLLPLALAQCGNADDSMLRRAGADALRVVFNALPAESAAPHAAGALAVLVPAMGFMTPDADEDEDEDDRLAADNVVSAVVAILRMFPFCADPAQRAAGEAVVGGATAVAETCARWLDVMPRVSDDDVCGDINGFFMQCVSEGHVAVMGADNANLPRVLDVMAMALDAEAEEEHIIVSQEVGNAMRAYWTFIQGQLGEEAARRVFEGLDVDVRDALNSAPQA